MVNKGVQKNQLGMELEKIYGEYQIGGNKGEECI